MSKEIPILFSTPMVQAILEGRKTQTRRTRGLNDVNENPDEWRLVEVGLTTIDGRVKKYGALFQGIENPKVVEFVPSPYGQPGDLLWVRETWRPSSWDENTGKFGVEFKDGGTTSFEPDCDWFERMWISISDEFDRKGIEPIDDEGDSGIYSIEQVKQLSWKPSIHMPKAAARIWLQVESVGVERLQDITEEAAIAEGVGSGFQMNAGWPDYTRIKNGVCELTQDTAKMSYATLWESINGKGTWDKNEWVWVIKYKSIKRKP